MTDHIEPAEIHHHREDHPLSLKQLPRTYMPFALLTMTGMPIVMLTQGDTLHPSVPGLAFAALLLLGVARRSRLAWSLLLTWNTFTGLAAAAASGGTLVVPSRRLFLLIGVASVGLLASPSILQHVGIHRRRSSAPERAA